MLNNILLQITASADSTTNAVNNAVTTAAPAPPAAQVTLTPMELMMKGGWVMVPLFILLLVAIYFGIERLIVISKASKLDSNFMKNVRDYLLSGKIDSARELCRSTNTPVSRTIEKGISRLGKPTREITEAMETHGRAEMAHVEKRLHLLSMTARIAPMLGFIGTIAGVVTIFYDISLSGDISIKSISGGLYQKMVSSGAGLIIGVVAFIFFHFLNTMADNVAKKIERSCMEFLDTINEPSK